MYPISDVALQTIRNPHKAISVAVHKNLITDVLTTLPILDGSVTVDSTAANRRMLDLTCPPQQSLWDALNTPGGEITVTKYLLYINGAREAFPLGVFIVDQDRIGYAPGDTIALTCPDRSLKVQRNDFVLNRASVASNATWQEIKRLVEACWGGSYPFPGWAMLDTSATTKVGPIVWDVARAAAIAQMASDSSVQTFFDANGQGVLRPVPVLDTGSTPVWRVDAGAHGVLIGGDRSRDRSRTRNAIVVTSSATDVTFDPVLVQDTTAGDSLNVTGPLGCVPYPYSSPTIRNSTQARAAGLTKLRQQLGIAQQLSLEAVGNPALDAEDVIEVVFPTTDANLPRPTELHIIDSVTHPLLPTGTQTILTRSTRPDTDGS